MNFTDFKAFNKYINVASPKHNMIDVGLYTPDFRSESPAVNTNYYRVSVKFDVKAHDGRSSMCFSSPNQPFEWGDYKIDNGYYVQITDNLISNNQHLRYTFLTYRLNGLLFLNDEEEQIITDLFKLSYKEYSKPDFSVDLLAGYSNLMLTHIAQFYKRQMQGKEQQYSPLVDRFFDQLESYYTKISRDEITQPSVQYFADNLNVTPNYLSDIIKHYTGKPALEHIHAHIINTSKNLLQNKTTTISQVADQLGFEYASYFTRFFRKMTGTAPSKFRNL
ncbi:helix-turn-helix domain-containing protein [Marinifilum caeruleilacunae]|nr:helix-turn-helix domain-containing protein [Marinifilum caeruleilacunae]